MWVGCFVKHPKSHVCLRLLEFQSRTVNKCIYLPRNPAFATWLETHNTKNAVYVNTNASENVIKQESISTRMVERFVQVFLIMPSPLRASFNPKQELSKGNVQELSVKALLTFKN